MGGSVGQVRGRLSPACGPISDRNLVGIERAMKHDTIHDRPGEDSTSEIRMREVGARKVSVREVRAIQVTLRQVSARQIGPDKLGKRQVSVAEVGIDRGNTVEVTVAKIASKETSIVDDLTRQIEAFEFTVFVHLRLQSVAVLCRVMHGFTPEFSSGEAPRPAHKL